MVRFMVLFSHMPQVSKRFIDKKTQDHIIKLFISGIALTKTENDAVPFLEDILTPTERLMLSKRFSIAFMLMEGYDYDSIVDVLKVSRSTIGRVNWWLQTKGSGVRRIRERIKSDQVLKNLWEDVQDVILDVVSNMHGTNWKETKKALWQHRQSRQKPF